VRTRLDLSFGYPVTFDTGGGSAIADAVVAGGGTLTLPTDPTFAGYAFTGWHTGSTTGPSWDPATAITAPVALFASWDLVPVGIRVTVSDSTPDQGDTIQITAFEVDILGGDMADVSDQVVVTSDNPLDVIAGNRVTFPHASPHVLTITQGAFQSTVTIQVTALPGALARTGPIVTGVDALLAIAVLGVGGLMVMSSRVRRGDRSRPGRAF